MPGIFLLRDDNQLVEMSEQPYDSERLLQELLENHPNLLAGTQIDPDEPRKWLLISRETTVPSELDGGARWYLDHLFLDQDAIPTLVEVKRSSDSRIRREVVGQMLDYAANAVVYWPIEALQAALESRCARSNLILDEVIGDFLGPDGNPETFWSRAKTNLQAGRVRLIFVADEIPAELARVIEFLNGQMDPAEVLALEVKQYVGPGLRSLVPRVIGQTVQAERKKAAGSAAGKQWDETSFFAQLEARRGAEDTRAARSILDWARPIATEIWFGTGSKDGSLIPKFRQGESLFYPFAIYTYGRVEIQFKSLKARPPFTDVSLLGELLRKLNEIPGVSIGEERLGMRPSIALATLGVDDHMKRFLAAMSWVLAQVAGAEPRAGRKMEPTFE